jgi:sortase A
MPKKDKLIHGILTGALVGALAGLAWIFGPSLWLEVGYQFRPSQAKLEGDQSSISAPAAPVSGFAGMFYSINQGFTDLNQGAEVLIAPLSTEFGVVIPKIMANVAVTADVNPADADIYQDVLRQAGGVAHAAGSAYPDEDGAVYIFGHSTDSNLNAARFNAVFYLLRKLEEKDLIIVYFRDREYRYRVKYKKVVDPTDLTDITNVENEKRLVLQTCWPPGTTWKRLLVVAEPESV